MKKLIHIEVTSCKECPYYVEMWFEDETPTGEVECSKTGKSFRMEDGDKIQDFCPFDSLS